MSTLYFVEHSSKSKANLPVYDSDLKSNSFNENQSHRNAYNPKSTNAHVYAQDINNLNPKQNTTAGRRTASQVDGKRFKPTAPIAMFSQTTILTALGDKETKALVTDNFTKKLKPTVVTTTHADVPQKPVDSNAESSAPIVVDAEPHDGNWTNNAIAENVESNSIEDEQKKLVLNVRKAADNSTADGVAKGRAKESDIHPIQSISTATAHLSSFDLISSLLLSDDYTYENEYSRERRPVSPIGSPLQCVIQQPPTAPTANGSLSTPALQSKLPTDVTSAGSGALAIEASQLICPSACSKDAMLNQLPETLEEIPVPESTDTMKVKVSESNATRTTTMPTTATTTKSSKNISVDAERPIELKDLPLSTAQNAAAQSTASTSTFSSSETSNSVYPMTKIDLKEPTPAESEDRPQSPSLNPDMHSVQYEYPSAAGVGATASNLITKKMSLIVGPTEINRSDNVDPQPGIVLPPNSPPSSCFQVQLVARIDGIGNTTLGSDEICLHDESHGFNITYHIPISKYMTESRFEVIFV